MGDISFEEAARRLLRASKRPSGRKANMGERMDAKAHAHGRRFLEQFYRRDPPLAPRIGVGPRGAASFSWRWELGSLRLDVDADGGYDFYLTQYGATRHGRGPRADHRIADRIARLTEGNTFTCVDCTYDTNELGEYYMVQDEVWMQAQLDATDGMLCIGCLEQRIGRRLKPADFIDAPINLPAFHSEKSRRLSERLGHTA